MFGMTDLEMYALPLVGIAIIALGCVPWMWMAIVAAKKRGVDKAGLQWFQFSLRSFLFWSVPIAAIAGWILSWEGVFFTKRSVLSQKAAALTLFACILCMGLFVRFMRRLLRESNQSRPPNLTD
jgi:hypothetical protein